MQIDFSQTITDFDGDVLPSGKTKTIGDVAAKYNAAAPEIKAQVDALLRLVPIPIPLTLKRVAHEGLGAVYEDERALDPDEKNKRFLIGLKVTGEASDFTVEEVALLKKVVGKGYGPLIMGRAWQMLEDAAKAKEPKTE
jgi:hypothetical protein